MRTVAAFAVVLLIAGTAQGAVITYEHAFALEEEWFSAPETQSGHIGFALPYDLWTIPAFDFSLGLPEVLLIDIEGTVTISGRLHDLGGVPIVNVWAIASTLNLVDGSLMAIGGAFASCTAAPCDFSETTPFSNFDWVLPSPNNSGWEVPWWSVDQLPEITVPIAFYGGDTFATLRDLDGNYIAAPVTFRTNLTGVARATYIYAPYTVPEPTTLLLLGSGLLGAEWKRRRRHG